MSRLQKTILIIFLFLGMFIFTQAARAQEVKVDQRCSAYLITKPTEEATGKPKCNITCNSDCIDAGKSCVYGTINNCSVVLEEEDINEDVPSLNIFGVDFGPPTTAIPRIIRTFLTGIFALISLIAIIMGLYGMYLRSTAADNPEKVELAMKVFKNAILGIIISFFGVVILQGVALLLGLTGNLLEFNLLPDENGAFMQLTAQMLNDPCSPDGTIASFIDENGAYRYECRAGRWIRQSGFIPRN